MTYFYCIESENCKTSGIVIYNDKVSTVEDNSTLIDFIYNEIKKLYGDKYTKENSVFVSLNKL